jgi:hypothetical protein
VRRSKGRACISLFDHLVGAREHRRRHGQSEHPGSLEIDHQFEFGRRLNRRSRKSRRRNIFSTIGSISSGLQTA